MTIYCEREDCLNNKSYKCLSTDLRISAGGECLSLRKNEELSALCVEFRCVPSEVEKPLALIVRGNWAGFGVKLEELGFSLIPKPRTGLFSFNQETTGVMSWCLLCGFEDEAEELRRLEAAGLNVEMHIDSTERKIWECNKVRSLMAPEEIERERQANSQPRLPRFVEGKLWNGKLYGYPGKRKIWLNGFEYPMNGVQEKEIENYVKAMERYEKNLALYA